MRQMEFNELGYAAPFPSSSRDLEVDSKHPVHLLPEDIESLSRCSRLLVAVLQLSGVLPRKGAGAIERVVWPVLCVTWATWVAGHWVASMGIRGGFRIGAAVLVVAVLGVLSCMWAIKTFRRTRFVALLAEAIEEHRNHRMLARVVRLGFPFLLLNMVGSSMAIGVFLALKTPWYREVFGTLGFWVLLPVTVGFGGSVWMIGFMAIPYCNTVFVLALLKDLKTFQERLRVADVLPTEAFGWTVLFKGHFVDEFSRQNQTILALVTGIASFSSVVLASFIYKSLALKILGSTEHNVFSDPITGLGVVLVLISIVGVWVAYLLPPIMLTGACTRIALVSAKALGNAGWTAADAVEAPGGWRLEDYRNFLAYVQNAELGIKMGSTQLKPQILASIAATWISAFIVLIQF